MVHDYHPLATARGVLSEHCERCTSMLVAHLDREHLKMLGIHTVPGFPEHLLTVLWETKAIKVQREMVRVLFKGDEHEQSAARYIDEAANQEPRQR